jgi:hypothetical protein
MRQYSRKFTCSLPQRAAGCESQLMSRRLGKFLGRIPENWAYKQGRYGNVRNSWYESYNPLEGGGFAPAGGPLPWRGGSRWPGPPRETSVRSPQSTVSSRGRGRERAITSVQLIGRRKPNPGNPGGDRQLEAGVLTGIADLKTICHARTCKKEADSKNVTPL